MTHVRAAGLRMRVARRGEGRPLLLITGIGANLEMWGPFERLVRGREVVAFDPPGAGGSQRPRRPLRMAGLARVVVSLLDALGLDDVDALGYSFGGGLAQELARRAPGRVRRLILCATAPGLGGVPPAPIPPCCSPRRRATTTPGSSARPSRAWPAAAPRATPRSSIARLPPGSRARPTCWGYAFQVYAAAGWTSLPWLHQIAQPTLIVAGDDDPVSPLANARLMARRMPAARLLVVEGGGHLLLLDQPETVVEEIHAFLDE